MSLKVVSGKASATVVWTRDLNVLAGIDVLSNHLVLLHCRASFLLPRAVDLVLLDTILYVAVHRRVQRRRLAERTGSFTPYQRLDARFAAGFAATLGDPWFTKNTRAEMTVEGIGRRLDEFHAVAIDERDATKIGSHSYQDAEGSV